MIRETIKSNIEVIPIPGVSALLTGLMASGLPTDRFIFEGFLPPKKGRSSRIKNIKNETLIIWGDKDTSYNFDQVDILNKNIKNSRLEIFKDCAHNVHLEQPDQFNNLVKEFISK